MRVSTFRWHQNEMRQQWKKIYSFFLLVFFCLHFENIWKCISWHIESDENRHPENTLTLCGSSNAFQINYHLLNYSSAGTYFLPVWACVQFAVAIIEFIHTLKARISWKILPVSAKLAVCCCFGLFFVVFAFHSCRQLYIRKLLLHLEWSNLCSENQLNQIIVLVAHFYNDNQIEIASHAILTSLCVLPYNQYTLCMCPLIIHLCIEMHSKNEVCYSKNVRAHTHVYELIKAFYRMRNDNKSFW